MRVKLSNSKLFFDEILGNLSLKEFSKLIKVNYSTLKKYRRGDLALPLELFDILIRKSPNKEYWIRNKKMFDDNWGALKGGLVASRMSDSFERAKHARKFRKIPKISILLNKFFCEFYGALLGDGCISRFKDWEKKERYVIQLTGNLRLDKNYWLYLRELLTKEYKLYSYYYERAQNNTCNLTIKNKGLCLNLIDNFDFPLGLKYEKIGLSNKILSLPWKIKKYVLRGLFDTDGCILANKREKYKYPWVVITSHSNSFREQIKQMLREEGYPAYITGSDVCVRGIANVKRWFSDIGSSNSRNILKYEYFLKHGFLPARLLTGLVG